MIIGLAGGRVAISLSEVKQQFGGLLVSSIGLSGGTSDYDRKQILNTEEKMKVRLKWGLGSFSGYMDEAVFIHNRHTGLCYMRKYTYPKRNPSADRMKLVMANLKLIQPSLGYKRNFFDYTISYNELKENELRHMQCWNNLYLKMLFAMQKSIPGIDLATLTRQDIYDQNLPCISVKAAIEAGLLPAVKDYQRFDKLI